MKDINIRFVDDADQRYATVGDYWTTPDSLEVRITRMRNDKHAQLILLHELVELFLVLQRNISLQAIDNFDMDYVDEGEPGDDPAAPYHKEHVFATHIEKRCADEMDVDWDDYDNAITHYVAPLAYMPYYDEE